MENLYSIIIDMGQYSTKIGYGGENEPRKIFPTICGYPKYKAIDATLQIGEKKQIFIGLEIIESLGLYKLRHPIANGGEIVDWGEFEAIVDYIFYLLRVDPAMCKIMFITNPFLSVDSKKKLFELFLEKHVCGAYYPVRGALLTMYSGGFNTGLIIDMGASNIRITPIYESYILQHAVLNVELAGSVLDKLLEKKIQEAGVPIESSVQRNLVRVLKERACFVSLNFDQDFQNREKFKKKYTLPDYKKITLDAERFIIPELMFDPTISNMETEPLHKAIINVVELCDIDIRRSLLQNIFITGGSSLFPNFEKRLKQELEKELIQRGKMYQNVKIFAPKGRALSNWVGGSILSQIPEFQSSWITRKRYFSEGLTDDMLNS